MDARLKSLLVLGKEHYERREFDRAEQAFHEVLALGGDHFADVHNMLAFILHDRGDLKGAEEHFKRAVEINPRYIEAHLNLAVTYSDLGRYEDAHVVYERIRELEGNDKAIAPLVRGKIANMHAELAQAYIDAGCRTEAIGELKKAVELCPTFADLHMKLGNLHRDGGNLPMAREHYATACTVNPKFVPARVLLGVTLLAIGHTEEAVAEWKAALAIDPSNKNAQMYLRMAETQRANRAKKAAESPLLAGIDDDEPTIAIEPLSRDPSSITGE
ncbi:MAG TPA: tetratricopeptide repeat protein [Polyangiaceae bacterium]|nr:tetratricopeptide repeat protein [Polyangiaceae bacterium]